MLISAIIQGMTPCNSVAEYASYKCRVCRSVVIRNALAYSLKLEACNELI